MKWWDFKVRLVECRDTRCSKTVIRVNVWQFSFDGYCFHFIKQGVLTKWCIVVPVGWNVLDCGSHETADIHFYEPSSDRVIGSICKDTKCRCFASVSSSASRRRPLLVQLLNRYYYLVSVWRIPRFRHQFCCLLPIDRQLSKNSTNSPHLEWWVLCVDAPICCLDWFWKCLLVPWKL